ncbi:MAG: DUF2541 family protein [Proteobacteria bacterium]|jgi:hypothetical protein|nr:DUF2541 family protein [Pseudomonadota bacterium]
MKNFALIALLTMISSISFASELLGTTKLARHRDDADLIRLTPVRCGLSEVRLQVNVRAAEIDHLAVQYANGMWDELSLRDRFARGSSSRWMNLRGLGDRCIKKIVVVGDSDGLPGRQATVSIFGR